MNTDLWGDVATWAGAVGTVGAFVAAFVQIKVERSARKDREKKETDLSEKAQASKVSSWVEDGKIVFSNSSNHPIYDLRVYLTDGSMHEERVMGPGTKRISDAKESGAHVSKIEFTDNQSATKWVREASKALRKR
ncbi:MAG: hypothetical protein ACK5MU_03910 [Candidatus Saccharimonadales bacterium]